MKFAELSPTTWNENCWKCMVANKRVIMESGDTVMGRPDAFLELLRSVDRDPPKKFGEWSQNPVVTGELWYCPMCERLWDVNGLMGYPVPCLWNGEITQSNDIINMPSTVVEIPPRPSPYHTLCTCCNTWREITGEKIIYQGTNRMVSRTHRCRKCSLVDTLVSEEPEVEDLMQQSSQVSRDMMMS